MQATSRACCRPRSPVQITVTALGSRGQAASSGPAVTPDMVTRPAWVTQVVFTRSVRPDSLPAGQLERHETRDPVRSNALEYLVHGVMLHSPGGSGRTRSAG